jgi:hypothetical protein
MLVLGEQPMALTYKHYILGILVLLMVAAPPVWWVCFRAVPLRISVETTYITEPLTADGTNVDYFLALEKLLYSPDIKSENNGYRLIIQSFGLPEESYSYLVSRPDSLLKQVYEKLGLDPDAEPTHTLKSTEVFLTEFLKKNDEPVPSVQTDHFPAATKNTIRQLFDKALHRGYWTLDEFPMLADWLTENSTGIDRLAEAVRKPTFSVPIVRENEFSVLIFLHDVRQLDDCAKSVRARACYRIGTGDISGAIEDTLTIHHLGRHVAKLGGMSNYHNGIRIEWMAREIPIAGNPEHPPTKEQLEYFMRELDKLPPKVTWQEIWGLEERLRYLAIIKQTFDRADEFRKDKETYIGDEFQFIRLPVIGKAFDANVFFATTNRLYDEILDMERIPLLEREYKVSPNLLGLITVQSRSKMFGNHLAKLHLDTVTHTRTWYQRYECIDHLKRLTLALLQYEAELGSMPTGDWREAVKPYFGDVSEDFFRCPFGETGYALVLTDRKTPETLLLVEADLDNISATGTIANDPFIFARAHMAAYVRNITASYNASFRSGIVRTETVQSIPRWW